MPGNTGKAIGSNTLLAGFNGAQACFAISRPQFEILSECLKTGHGVLVPGRRVRAAKSLVLLGLGTLSDDGPTPGNPEASGERFMFKVTPGVWVRG